MISKETLDQYQMTIGIECHVQLKTKTKLFSAVSNDARDAVPNTLISPIDYGLPGVLPVLNEKAVELAVRAGKALNAEVAHFSKFDRKHYFYPDLPKGYQITQFDQPTVGEGYVDVPFEGGSKRVGITRAHIEEDAGKSTHPGGKDYSLVDLNRAGTPLVEIVSEPDIDSPQLAKAYVRELYLLMKYADVSEVDLFQGNMRFDVNLSVAKKGSDTLGTRSEVKNLNSFRSVEKAAEYEFKRQVEVVESGGKVVQETRGWDDNKMRTESQRGKEEAHDYRYFPEPDVPPIVLNEDRISEIKASVGLMPSEVRERLTKAGVDSSIIETILPSRELSNLIMKFSNSTDKKIKGISNQLVSALGMALNRNEGFEISDALDLDVQVKVLDSINELSNQSKISSNTTDTLIEDLMLEWKTTLQEDSDGNLVVGSLEINASVARLSEDGRIEEIDVEKIAEQNNLLQQSDSGAIAQIVSDVLSQNQSAAEDVKNGEMKAIGFLVGQVMKNSKGQANPQMAQEEIKKQLGV